MAGIDGSISMDMKDYGMEGIVVLRKPRLTRRKQAENALGNLARMDKGELRVTESSLGDVETVTMLTFVESAPFPHDLFNLKAFYDYCDRMDDNDYGSATRFWKDLTDNILRLSEDKEDPSQGSVQGSQTESSD